MQRDSIDISVNEAGRRGGLAVLKKYGKNHFRKIGQKGQKILRARYPNKASEWGRKGGRPRKSALHMHEGSKTV